MAVSCFASAYAASIRLRHVRDRDAASTRRSTPSQRGRRDAGWWSTCLALRASVYCSSGRTKSYFTRTSSRQALTRASACGDTMPLRGALLLAAGARAASTPGVQTPQKAVARSRSPRLRPGVGAAAPRRPASDSRPAGALDVKRWSQVPLPVSTTFSILLRHAGPRLPRGSRALFSRLRWRALVEAPGFANLD